MADVQSVVEELCYCPKHDSENDNSGSPSSSCVTWGGEQRLQMDRLLSAIRPDVTRLADQRLQQQQHRGGGGGGGQDQSLASLGHEMGGESNSQPSLQYQDLMREYYDSSSSSLAEGGDEDRDEEEGCFGVEVNDPPSHTSSIPNHHHHTPPTNRSSSSETMGQVQSVALS
jgi:hypothetical protein